MQITAAEFKMNMGKYLSLAASRAISITKNGRRVAKLTNPAPDRVALLDGLVGIARGADASPEALRRERLERQ